MFQLCYSSGYEDLRHQKICLIDSLYFSEFYHILWTWHDINLLDDVKVRGWSLSFAWRCFRSSVQNALHSPWKAYNSSFELMLAHITQAFNRRQNKEFWTAVFQKCLNFLWTHHVNVQIEMAQSYPKEQRILDCCIPKGCLNFLWTHHVNVQIEMAQSYPKGFWRTSHAR